MYVSFDHQVVREGIPLSTPDSFHAMTTELRNICANENELWNFVIVFLMLVKLSNK